jgi:hypothetical protein
MVSPEEFEGIVQVYHQQRLKSEQKIVLSTAFHKDVPGYGVNLG